MGEDYSNLSKSIAENKQIIYPGARKQSSRSGCLTVFFGILIIAVLGVITFLFIYPSLTPNKIRGSYMDAVVVPDSNNADKLWILTDGSFSYISEKKSAGYHSVGRKGLFCKTWFYLYDPATNKVLKKIKTPLDELPPPTKLFYINNMIWKVYGDWTGYEPGIFVYDPKNGEEILNTKNFIDKYPELQSGLSKMRIDENPVSLHFETKDGQKPVFDIAEDKLYKDESEYQKTIRNDVKEITVFALGPEKSGETSRKKLFRVTGPESELGKKEISENYLTDPNTLKFFAKSEAEQILKDKYFLLGTILFQDAECCIIFHQTQLGKNSDRLLSCIDKTGNMLWTCSTKDVLYSNLAASESDSFSDMFFIKSKVHASRTGNMVLFKYDSEGVIGFDYKSGKKLFDL
jgi:hypothetical protein